MSEQTRDTQDFPPTEPHAESREETIERALADDPMHSPHEAPADEDPITARGVTGRAITRTHLFGIAGAIIGAAIGLVLALGPIDAPFMADRGTAGTIAGTIGYMLFLAFAFSLVFTALSGLVYSAREDGRIERTVEEETGRRPGAPADPLDPKYDP